MSGDMSMGILSVSHLLLYLVIDVLGTSILLQIPNVAWPTKWRHVLGDHGYRI